MQGKGLPRSGVEHIRLEKDGRGTIEVKGNTIIYKERNTGRAHKTWCNSNTHAQATLRGWRKEFAMLTDKVGHERLRAKG